MKLPSEEGNDAFSRRNICCESQSRINQLLQKGDSSKNKVYDCSESKDLWEETSFDVLVDDARNDQSVSYVEDTICLHVMFQWT